MRKSIVYTATDGRDAGTKYVITEMPASKVEKWARKALSALAKSGVEIPTDVENAGAAGLASMGFQALAGLDDVDAEYLMDEMMTCVQANPSAEVVRALIEDDIQEVSTRFKIRMEVFKLHTGFSLDVAAPKPPTTSTETTSEGSSITKTSRARSER